MKKTLFYAGAALAMVFSLNSCNKEIENPNENNDKKGIPFEIVANPVQTRTQMDGLDTKWVANDAINVFHSVSGATPKTYVSDGEFTIADVSTNLFQGTVSEALNAENSYDWYMVYPYNQHLVSVNNVGDNPARYYIGGRSDEAQTQNGNDNNEHLAGDKFPLFGVVTGLAANETPSISVNHVASYIEVSVTNNTEEPLTVESVSFTAPDGEKIMGYFNIDFAANPISFTMYNTYASETASLTVNNGEEIATGEKGSFFLGIKPFTVTSGVLKVKVNGYEKEIPITKSTSFSAGKIKKINFNYDKAVTTEDATYIFNTADGLTELGIDIPSSSGKGTSLDGKNLVKNGISLALSKGTGTNDPFAWKTTSALQLRTYLGNTLTFTAPSGYSVTEIKFSSNGAYTASTGTWNAPTWSGEASAVTLTRTGSGKHEVNTITVTCTKQAPKVLASIELGGNYQTEFYVNDAFDYSGLVVTAHYADGTQQQVSPTSVSTPDMSVVANNVPVTVTYTEGDVTKTASYTVSVIVRPVYTVTLADDNTELTAELGGSVALPSRSVEGYTFEGWSVTDISQPTTTAPELIEVGSYSPVASITLYPVFSKGENKTCWVQTALSEVTAGKYVLISTNGAAFNGAIESGHGQSTTDYIEFENGIASEIPAGACILTLTESGNGFTMYNSAHGYLYASKASSGNLAWHQTESSYWYYSFLNDQDNWVYASNNARLRTYSGTFRTYGGNNNSPLTIAKETTVINKTYTSNPE